MEFSGSVDVTSLFDLQTAEGKELLGMHSTEGVVNPTHRRTNNIAWTASFRVSNKVIPIRDKHK